MDAKRHLVATLCTKLIFCFFFILQWITNLTNYNSALHNYYIYNQFNKVMWPRVTWPETSYNYSMLHITKMDFSTKIMSWSLATTAAPALVLCYLLKEKQILRKNATQSYFVTTVNFLIIVQIWMLNELKCFLLIFEFISRKTWYW